MKKFLSVLTIVLFVLGVSASAYAYQYGYGLAGLDLGTVSVSYSNTGTNGANATSAYVSSLGQYESGGAALAYDDGYLDVDAYYTNVMNDWAVAYTSNSFAATGIVSYDRNGNAITGSVAGAQADYGTNEEAGALAGSYAAAYGVYAQEAGDLTVSIEYYMEGEVGGDGLGYSAAGSGVLMGIFDECGDGCEGDLDGRWMDVSTTYGMDSYWEDGTLYATITGLEAGDMFNFFVGTAAYAYANETAPVPEPATMLLLGTGLLGIAGMGRKKIIKK